MGKEIHISKLEMQVAPVELLDKDDIFTLLLPEVSNLKGCGENDAQVSKFRSPHKFKVVSRFDPPHGYPRFYAEEIGGTRYTYISEGVKVVKI